LPLAPSSPTRRSSDPLGRRSGIQVARKVVRSGINPIGEPGGVLFRRRDYLAVGGWHPCRRWAMDLDLWVRLLPCGRPLGPAETPERKSPPPNPPHLPT